MNSETVSGAKKDFVADEIWFLDNDCVNSEEDDGGIVKDEP